MSLVKPCKSINAKVMDVLPQKDAADCGLYCLAYCISLAYEEDPCSCVNSQAEMRVLLKACLEKNT